MNSIHNFIVTGKILFIVSVLFALNLQAAQIDTIKIIKTEVAPKIDGDEGDICWEQTSWHAIDQVWIKWGETLESTDFSGKFKVVWSEKKNLLYFLVRTVDDVIVDNYIPGVTSDYYNFDVVEVFIDEDRSKGLHIVDDDITGENAENAFSYHINVPFPPNNSSTDSFLVQDIAGTSAKQVVVQYNSHFDAFMLKLKDNVAYWEFALKVYNDTYTNSDPESSRVILGAGKVMGLSLAYCDNDDPNEKTATRDNFIGSVWVPEEAYNDHWMDAEYFGVAKLIDDTEIPTGLEQGPGAGFKVFPNPARGTLFIDCGDKFIRGPVNYSIYSIDGKLIGADKIFVTGMPEDLQIELPDLHAGLYLMSIEGKSLSVQNLIEIIP
jgi:hypothetical protein